MAGTDRDAFSAGNTQIFVYLGNAVYHSDGIHWADIAACAISQATINTGFVATRSRMGCGAVIDSIVVEAAF